MRRIMFEKKIIIVLLVLFFGVILIFNFLTPLIADDYNYSFIFQNENVRETFIKVSKISDIFISMKNHYFIMNGRLIDHFFVQLMLMLDKKIFNIINTIVYFSLGIVLQYLSIGRKKFNIKTFALIEFCMFMFHSIWGQTCLWLTGSCNYLWSSLLAFSYLLPFRFYLDNDKNDKSIAFYVLMFLWGFIVGWTNENLTPAVIASVVMFIVIFKIKKYRIPIWAIVGLIANVLGFIPMLLCPSKCVAGGEVMILVDRIKLIISNIPKLTYNMIIPILPLIGICIFALIIKLPKKEENTTSVLLIMFVFAAVSISVCLLASYTSYRNNFFAENALIVCVAILVQQLGISKNKRLEHGIALLMIAVMATQVINTSYEMYHLYRFRIDREAYITEAIKQGKDSVGIWDYKTGDTYSPQCNLSDINNFDEFRLPAEVYYGIKIYNTIA